MRFHPNHSYPENGKNIRMEKGLFPGQQPKMQNTEFISKQDPRYKAELLAHQPQIAARYRDSVSRHQISQSRQPEAPPSPERTVEFRDGSRVPVTSKYKARDLSSSSSSDDNRRRSYTSQDDEDACPDPDSDQSQTQEARLRETSNVRTVTIQSPMSQRVSVEPEICGPDDDGAYEDILANDDNVFVDKRLPRQAEEYEPRARQPQAQQQTYHQSQAHHHQQQVRQQATQQHQAPQHQAQQRQAPQPQTHVPAHRNQGSNVTNVPEEEDWYDATPPRYSPFPVQRPAHPPEPVRQPVYTPEPVREPFRQPVYQPEPVRQPVHPPEPISQPGYYPSEIFRQIRDSESSAQAAQPSHYPPAPHQYSPEPSHYRPEPNQYSPEPTGQPSYSSAPGAQPNHPPVPTRQPDHPPEHVRQPSHFTAPTRQPDPTAEHVSQSDHPSEPARQESAPRGRSTKRDSNSMRRSATRGRKQPPQYINLRGAFEYAKQNPKLNEIEKLQHNKMPEPARLRADPIPLMSTRPAAQRAAAAREEAAIVDDDASAYSSQSRQFPESARISPLHVPSSQGQQGQRQQNVLEDYVEWERQQSAPNSARPDMPNSARASIPGSAHAEASNFTRSASVARHGGVPIGTNHAALRAQEAAGIPRSLTLAQLEWMQQQSDPWSPITPFVRKMEDKEIWRNKHKILRGVNGWLENSIIESQKKVDQKGGSFFLQVKKAARVIVSNPHSDLRQCPPRQSASYLLIQQNVPLR